jgi:hypothetical protein
MFSLFSYFSGDGDKYGSNILIFSHSSGSLFKSYVNLISQSILDLLNCNSLTYIYDANFDFWCIFYSLIIWSYALSISINDTLSFNELSFAFYIIVLNILF